MKIAVKNIELRVGDRPADWHRFPAPRRAGVEADVDRGLGGAVEVVQADADGNEQRQSELMGGRAAEEIVMNHMTTGAGNDIERATDLARKMVCEWGMSEKLGPLTFGQQGSPVFLGRDVSARREVSDQMAQEIDSEIKRVVMETDPGAFLVITEAHEVLGRGFKPVAVR